MEQTYCFLFDPPGSWQANAPRKAERQYVRARSEAEAFERATTMIHTNNWPARTRLVLQAVTPI